MRFNKELMFLVAFFLVSYSGFSQESYKLVKTGDSSWRAAEQEASLNYSTENGSAVLNLSITVDHNKDAHGNPDGKLRMNWPRMNYNLPSGFDMGKFKSLQFEYKATVAYKVNHDAKVFISFSGGRTSYDYKMTLQKNDNQWHKVVIDLNDIYKMSKTTASDWNPLRFIKIGVAERDYINGEKIDIAIKHIKFSSHTSRFELTATNDLMLDLEYMPKDSTGNCGSGVVMREAVIQDGELVINDTKGYLLLQKNDSLNIGKGDITIIAKVKLKEKQLVRSGILTRGAGSNKEKGYAFLYRAPKKSLYFYLSNGTTRTVFQSKTVLLNDNQWHTIAVSLKRGERAIFAIDGKACEIRGDSLVGEDIRTKQNMFIGSWGKAHYLNGCIREVRMYRSAFSKEKLKKMTK